MKKIPKKYMVQGSYENGGWRKVSPIGQELQHKPLEELECPCCGEKAFYQHFDEFMMGIGDYYITCDNCDWACPTGSLMDCGETICELKEWLEAWYLLGKPRDRIDEDLTLEFYPEGEYREAMRNEKNKEYGDYDDE